MNERFRDSLRRLTGDGGGRAKLRLAPLTTPGPIPAGVGEGSPDAGGGETAGIASPLTEQDAAQRTYHPVRQVLSSDGLFALESQPLKSLVMTDANGREVTLEFADPDA